MNRFLLFIFSSETLQWREIPRQFWMSLLLTAALLAAAEAGTRLALAPMGEYLWAYWDPEAGVKYESYRRAAAEGRAPGILCVGDSTAARGFDPRSFRRAAQARERAWNLAWPANFPRALRATTFPLLREAPAAAAPRVVFLMQDPRGYLASATANRFEESILSSRLIRKYEGQTLVGDQFQIARWSAAAPLLLERWKEGDGFLAEPPNLGFMPLEGVAAPAAAPASEGRGNGEKADAAADFAFSEEKRRVIHEFLRLGRCRGFEVILVIPPTTVRPLPEFYAAHKDWLESLTRELGAGELWDYSDSGFLSPGDFYNSTRLNREGAEKFSAELGRRYREEGLAARQFI